MLAFLYNMLRLGQPLLIAGAGFGFATLGYIAWGLIRNRRGGIPPVGPCRNYLRWVFERKRRALLLLRNCILLLIPAMVTSWLGHGPELRAKTRGVLMVMGLLIAFLWWAFSHQARKVESEIEGLMKH
jgi:hypothetical protein